MPTPSHCLIRAVAHRSTTRHHYDFARETKHVRTFSRDVLRITKYISPKKPGHSPKKPSAIPGGSPAQIPVGLAQGLPPGPAMGLPLGLAQGIADDVYFIGGQP